jgi:hypothetical protein
VTILGPQKKMSHVAVFATNTRGDTYTKSTPVTQSKPMGGIRLTRSDARDISPTCAQVINLWRTCGGN